VPPQSLPASGALGPTLRLPASLPADLPSVTGPLQWPGEAAAQPPTSGDDPAAARLRPGPPAQPATQAGLQNGTPLQPQAASTDPERRLVLDRHRRLLMVLENGKERHRYSVAVGMPGWETPVGQFEVIEKTANPVWEHPATGVKIKPGPDNPLGSRWIGFHRDCSGRKGFNGLEHLELKGCVIAGFHGTPNRSSVGRAVSHGCVRLYDENVQELFDLVRIGTQVTVLP
jgi:lipoprotein-anchoring transpeptidase ErfK/SrfK